MGGDGSLQAVAIEAAITLMCGNDEDHALAVTPVVTGDARLLELPACGGRVYRRQDIQRIVGSAVPHPCRKNDQCRERADDDRIDEWFEPGDDSLADGLVGLRGRVRHRR